MNRHICTLGALLLACNGKPLPTDQTNDTDQNAFADTGNDTTEEEEDSDTDTQIDTDVDTGDSGQTSTLDTSEPIDSEPDASSDFERCFEDISTDTDTTGPDYDQYNPTVGSHCSGTNHQDIVGIERVVFLGDSVTVGTPPADYTDWYRNLLVEELATEFSLEEPDWLWQNVDVIEGTTYTQDGGDFASCAEWGARTDDLMQDGNQVEDCFPEEERDKTTLVIMTMGGNDLQKLTEGFMDGDDTSDLWVQTEEFMALMREAAEWIKEPGQFPNGVHLIFTNLYEFTDATGDVTSCPVAELAGFSEAVTDPALAQMVVWAMEEFMSIATDTESDMLFLLESFCGHGFNYDDTDGQCYRGDEAELWFDITCIHPNDLGHAAMSEMFLDVIRE